MDVIAADTITALASAPPPAERVVIRLSGPASFTAASALTRSSLSPGVIEASLHLDDLPIPITAWVFRGPRSYTGEDVVELHLPGSPWIVADTMRKLLAFPSVRMATAGEFTARAYLAGKMDLTAAEGVALAVAAADERQLRAARQLLAGTLAGKVRALSETLATLLALLEAGIDFTDEDVSFIAEDALREGIAALRASIDATLTAGAKFSARGEMPVIVLVGRPNAGKSSLMNALLREQRVVVSPVAGTTRDAIYADLQLARGKVLLADVAGFEDASAGDDIAREMAERAREALRTADIVVELVDGVGDDRAVLSRAPDLTVRTKQDLPSFIARDGMMSVSAATGHGLSELRAALDAQIFGQEGGQAIALNSRHVGQLQAAAGSLGAAGAAIGSGDEFVAAALREALDHLGEITGVISPDDVLGKVFATFCIGK
jgi:tRNA modification GTPase